MPLSFRFFFWCAGGTAWRGAYESRAPPFALRCREIADAKLFNAAGSGMYEAQDYWQKRAATRRLREAANRNESRIDPRLRQHQTDKRQVVAVVREREIGRLIPARQVNRDFGSGRQIS